MPKLKVKNNTILQAIADEAILSAVLNLPREYLLAHPEIKISAATTRKIKTMQKRVLEGEPLAYVIGEKWFCGAKFAVNKSVLIPRPETELLIDLALEKFRLIRPAKLFDIGTGSGAIAVTLARSTGKEITAIDISKPALAVATRNAKILLEKKAGLVKFVHSDLLKKIDAIPNRSLICANLPYLSMRELSEPTIRYEPKIALLGSYKNKAASASIICELLEQIAAKRKGSIEIILEMNYNQSKIVTKKARQLFPDSEIATHKDYSKFDRIVTVSVR